MSFILFIFSIFGLSDITRLSDIIKLSDVMIYPSSQGRGQRSFKNFMKKQTKWQRKYSLIWVIFSESSIWCLVLLASAAANVREDLEDLEDLEASQDRTN